MLLLKKSTGGQSANGLEVVDCQGSIVDRRAVHTPRQRDWDLAEDMERGEWREGVGGALEKTQVGGMSLPMMWNHTEDVGMKKSLRI